MIVNKELFQKAPKLAYQSKELAIIFLFCIIMVMTMTLTTIQITDDDNNLCLSIIILTTINKHVDNIDDNLHRIRRFE